MELIQPVMAFGSFSACSTERTSIGCAPDDLREAIGRGGEGACQQLRGCAPQEGKGSGYGARGCRRVDCGKGCGTGASALGDGAELQREHGRVGLHRGGLVERNQPEIVRLPVRARDLDEGVDVAHGRDVVGDEGAHPRLKLDVVRFVARDVLEELLNLGAHGQVGVLRRVVQPLGHRRAAPILAAAVLIIVVAAAVIDALSSLDLAYPKVDAAQLKELAAAKDELLAE